MTRSMADMHNSSETSPFKLYNVHHETVAWLDLLEDAKSPLFLVRWSSSSCTVVAAWTECQLFWVLRELNNRVAYECIWTFYPEKVFCTELQVNKSNELIQFEPLVTDLHPDCYTDCVQPMFLDFAFPKYYWVYRDGATKEKHLEVLEREAKMARSDLQNPPNQALYSSNENCLDSFLVPEELLLFILSFLEVKDIVKLTRVSKSMNQFIRENIVWKQLFRKDFDANEIPSTVVDNWRDLYFERWLFSQRKVNYKDVVSKAWFSHDSPILKEELELYTW